MASGTCIDRWADLGLSMYRYAGNGRSSLGFLLYFLSEHDKLIECLNEGIFIMFIMVNLIGGQIFRTLLYDIMYITAACSSCPIPRYNFSPF